MTRTFDLSSSIDDTYFPLSALRALSARSEETGVTWIVIGAMARDPVVHIPLGHAPARATKDVDIGIAVPAKDGFTTFTEGLTQRRNGQHAFSIEGVPIDIVPFGGIEADGHITFPDGHRLNVIGLSEAASSPDQVRLAENLTVSVASLEAQCPLKLLAWRDRHTTDTKDALDLITLLSAGSEGCYAEETWDHDYSLTANDDDIRLAGSFRLGLEGAALFGGPRREAASTILRDGAQRALLLRHMSQHGAKEILDAYVRGFVGLARGDR
ncbi:MAG: hypothetical protein ABIS84_04370 [Arachnia sp.]